MFQESEYDYKAKRKGCECERACHGAVESHVHAYAAPAKTTPTQTPYGVLHICKVCAETCMKDYAAS